MKHFHVASKCVFSFSLFYHQYGTRTFHSLTHVCLLFHMKHYLLILLYISQLIDCPSYIHSGQPTMYSSTIPQISNFTTTSCACCCSQVYFCAHIGAVVLLVYCQAIGRLSAKPSRSSSKTHVNGNSLVDAGSERLKAE